MSPIQRHIRFWSKCTRCVLSEHRHKVVLVRGKVPAPILFIGEAPGASEDVIGDPFVGPAGKLLDEIINHAFDGQYDYALTNLVACIPKDETDTKVGEPTKQCIEACAPRLEWFVTRLCKPKLIVCVGALATKWVDKQFGKKDFKFLSIKHPAHLMRMNVAAKGLEIQRATVQLDDFVTEWQETL